jgi:hypothetical protein
MTDDLVKRLRDGWTEDGICEDFDEDVLLIAADRIEELEAALRLIADTPIGKEVPDRTTAWGLAFHMQQTAKDALKEGEHE